MGVVLSFRAGYLKNADGLRGVELFLSLLGVSVGAAMLGGCVSV